MQEKISKPNRSRKFNAKGRRVLPMPVDGADVRNLARIREERAKGIKEAKKKGAK